MFIINKNPQGRPRHNDILTPSEWRVLELIRHGLSNSKIANALGISKDGVKFHVENIKLKLCLKNKIEIRNFHGISKQSKLFGSDIDMGQTELNTLMQISRYALNLAATREFFEMKLGLKVLFAFPNLVFFDLGSVRLMLCESKKNAEQSILYFNVKDINAAKDTLEEKGVKFLSAPHMIHRHENGTEEWLAIFEDNEGRPLGIMSII